MAPMTHSTYDENGRKVYGVFDKQETGLRNSVVLPFISNKPQNKSFSMRRGGGDETSGSKSDSYKYSSYRSNKDSWGNSINASSSNNNISFSHRHLQPLAEKFRDEEAYGDTLYDDTVVDDIFQDDNMDVRGRNIDEGPNNKRKRKRRIIALLSILFLGAMAGLIYYLFQIISAGDTSTPLGNNDGGNTSSSSVGDMPTIAPGSIPSIADDNSVANNGSDANAFSDGTAGTADSPRISIPLPPATLNSTCSRESIAEDQFNIFRCESSCREAACCYARNSETGIESCLEGNDEDCTRYSPSCDFIYGPLDAQQPNLTNSSTNSSTIAPAPDNLVSLCDSSEGSAEDCFNACFDGYCCFSSAADIMAGMNTTAPSCYDREICEGYIPCLLGIIAAITPESNSSDLPRPPNNLSELCSDDSMDTQDGAVNCLSHCSKALCCVDLNPSTSCITENIGICTTYTPCSRILQRVAAGPAEETPSNQENVTGSTIGAGDEPIKVPPPPENLADTCDRGSFEGFPENLRNCAAECDAALCCFQVGDSSCLKDELSVCAEYTPCRTLVGIIDATGENVPLPPSDLDELCGDQALSTQTGRVECLRGCFPGLCCLDPNDPCFAKNAFSCLRYDPCIAVVDMDSGGFNGIVPLLNRNDGDSTDVDVPLPPLEIVDVCSQNNLLASPNGVVDCVGACVDSVCCTSDEKNCYASNKGVCDSYGDCLNLLFLPTPSAAPTSPPSLSGGELAAPPEDLAFLCSSELAFSQPDCRIRCEAAACCLATDISSCANDLDRCVTFAPCLILSTAGTISTNSTLSNTTVIERACSPEEEGSDPEECYDLCFDGTCCFLAPTEDASCSSNDQFCDYYLACAILYTDLDQDSNTTVSANFTLIAESCDSHKMHNHADAWEQCAELCFDGECCLLDQSDEDNCLNRSDFCDAYSPCLVLLAMPRGNDTISIEDACHPDTVHSSNLSSLDCELFCSEGLCCHLPDDDVGSCSNETSFCEFFEVCDVLFASNKTGVSLSQSPSLSPSPPGYGSASAEPSLSGYPTARSSLGNGSTSLEPSVSEYPTALSIIKTICNAALDFSDPEVRDACVAVCVEGGCCFAAVSLDISCKNQVDFCAYFEPCSALFDDETPSSTDPPSVKGVTGEAADPGTDQTDIGFDPPLDQTDVDAPLGSTDIFTDAFIDGGLDSPDPEPVIDPPLPEPANTIDGPQDLVDTPNLTVDNCTQYDINAGNFVKCLEMCDVNKCCFDRDESTGICDPDDANVLCPEVVALCNQVASVDSPNRSRRTWAISKHTD